MTRRQLIARRRQLVARRRQLDKREFLVRLPMTGSLAIDAIRKAVE